jgi:hypothetical protein
MSLEELMLEHIKALNENTKALRDYTNALNYENKAMDVEHTKISACKFCGVTYKTLDKYVESGLLIASRSKNGKREYYKEKDLVNLCETKQLFTGDYGQLKSNPRSLYFEC